MIESFLGTMFLCIIIISLALSFIQYIGIKVNIKTYEPEIIYIGDYVQSIIIFLAILHIIIVERLDVRKKVRYNVNVNVR